MQLTRYSICLLIAAAALSSIAVADAAALSRKQAMAACKVKYGKGVTDVVIRKDGRIVCQEGPGRNATRQQVYDYCMKSLGATQVYLRKKANGKWVCLYYGRY